MHQVQQRRAVSWAGSIRGAGVARSTWGGSAAISSAERNRRAPVRAGVLPAGGTQQARWGGSCVWLLCGSCSMPRLLACLRSAFRRKEGALLGRRDPSAPPPRPPSLPAGAGCATRTWWSHGPPTRRSGRRRTASSPSARRACGVTACLGGFAACLPAARLGSVLLAPCQCPDKACSEAPPPCLPDPAQVWRGPLIAAGGFKRESGMQAVESGGHARCARRARRACCGLLGRTTHRPLALHLNGCAVFEPHCFAINPATPVYFFGTLHFTLQATPTSSATAATSSRTPTSPCASASTRRSTPVRFLTALLVNRLLRRARKAACARSCSPLHALQRPCLQRRADSFPPVSSHPPQTTATRSTRRATRVRRQAPGLGARPA